MADRQTVIVSSTGRDLPEHRAMVRDACLATGYFPDMMESLRAEDVDAVTKSLEMVDRADVYVCVLGRSYGTVPKGQPKGKERSITEMEFERALERKIPILVFLMDELHPLTISMVETSKLAQRRLQKFKDRASAGRLRGRFVSPEQLKTQVMAALDNLTLQRMHAAAQAPSTLLQASSAGDAQLWLRLHELSHQLSQLQSRLGVPPERPPPA